MKKYHFGGFYIDFEHYKSGCDPEFSQFGAYWHIWFTMDSCPQGQISFLFDGHGVFLSSFAVENLILKKMIPHMPYLAMLEKVDMSG